MSPFLIFHWHDFFALIIFSAWLACIFFYTVLCTTIDEHQKLFKLKHKHALTFLFIKEQAIISKDAYIYKEIYKCTQCNKNLKRLIVSKIAYKDQDAPIDFEDVNWAVAIDFENEFIYPISPLRPV
jgi:hypothetical protein